jgi:hypothetical protein
VGAPPPPSHTNLERPSRRRPTDPSACGRTHYGASSTRGRTWDRPPERVPRPLRSNRRRCTGHPLDGATTRAAITREQTATGHGAQNFIHPALATGTSQNPKATMKRSPLSSTRCESGVASASHRNGLFPIDYSRSIAACGGPLASRMRLLYAITCPAGAMSDDLRRGHRLWTAVT